MKKMACKKSLIRISAFLDDELSRLERQRLESHLAVCPDCSGYLEELRGVSGLIRSLPALEPGREAILELKARLRLVTDDAKESVCQAMPIRLSAYLDDELSASDRERVKSHLAVCPDCSSYLEELRAVCGQVRLLSQLKPREEVIRELKARIRSAEVPKQKRLAPVFSFPRLAPARFALAAAAVAVLFFAVFLFKFSPFGPGAHVADVVFEAQPSAGDGLRSDGSKSVVIDLADFNLNDGKARLLAESVPEENEDSDYSGEDRSEGSFSVFDPYRGDTRGRVVHSVSFGDFSARHAPVSSRVLFVSYGN